MADWRTDPTDRTAIYCGTQYYGRMSSTYQAEQIVAVLQRHQSLWDRVVAWRDKHEITCGESIFQMDAPQIDAAPLCDDLVQIVGYIKHPDDEEDA